MLGPPPSPPRSDRRVRFVQLTYTEGSSAVKKEVIGSSFDSWLLEERLYAELQATALERVLAGQKGLPHQTYIRMLLRGALKRQRSA